MVRRGSVELAAKIMREKIAGHDDENRVRQRLLRLAKGRVKERPIAVCAILGGSLVIGAFENRLPFLGLGGGQPIDKLRVRHRVEMEVRHHQKLDRSSRLGVGSSPWRGESDDEYRRQRDPQVLE